jgi:hypothetical protein
LSVAIILLSRFNNLEMIADPRCRGDLAAASLLDARAARQSCKAFLGKDLPRSR